MADAQQLLWIRLPNGQVRGPFPKEKVKASMRAGRIPEGSAVAAAALGPWKAIGQVPSGAVQASRPPRQPPPPYHAAVDAEVPQDEVSSQATEPAAEPSDTEAGAAAAEGSVDPAQSALPVPLVKTTSWWRILLAFAVAGMSDLLGALFTLVPPIYIPLDLATGATIWFALGRPVLLLAVLVLEAIPGIGLVPMWTLVVAMIVFTGKLPARSGAAAAKGNAATQVVGALTQLAGGMTRTEKGGSKRGKRSK